MLQLCKAVVQVFCERRILAGMPLQLDFSMCKAVCEGMALHVSCEQRQKPYLHATKQAEVCLLFEHAFTDSRCAIRADPI